MSWPISEVSFHGRGRTPSFGRLLRMPRGEQPDRDAGDERPLGDRRRAGHEQDLLRLVARVVDHASSTRPEKRRLLRPGNGDDGLQAIRRLVAAARGADALVDVERQRRVVLRHRQRRRMDERGQLELVVGDGEVAAVRRQAEVLGVAGGGQRDARLELRRIDRVAEAERGDQLLQVGVARILVELALGDGRGERRALELEACSPRAGRRAPAARGRPSGRRTRRRRASRPWARTRASGRWSTSTCPAPPATARCRR